VCRPKLRMCYREVATRPAERRTTTVAPSTCRQVSVVGAAAGTTVLACPDLMKRSTAARVRRAALPSLLLHAAASCCYMLLHLVAPRCCILLLHAAAFCCSPLLPECVQRVAAKVEAEMRGEQKKEKDSMKRWKELNTDFQAPPM
jgi:hypothetical protein